MSQYPQGNATSNYGAPAPGGQPAPSPGINPHQSAYYQAPGGPQAPQYPAATPAYGQQPTYGSQPQPTYGAPQGYGGQPAGFTGPVPLQKQSGGIGKMFDQAVSSGKPMFNKFSKKISSIGNKPHTPTPQHLESYQNYQQHQGQTQPQNPYQTGSYNPQPQHGQQPPQAQVAQPYASPASTHSGQTNYFPQNAQQPGALQAQTAQAGQPGNQLNPTPQPGQVPQQFSPVQPQNPYMTGQQIGGSPAPQSPPASLHGASPNPMPGPPSVPTHPNQQQIGTPMVPPHPNQNTTGSPLLQQQGQPMNPTPPPQQYGGPMAGIQQQQQQQQQQVQNPQLQNRQSFYQAQHAGPMVPPKAQFSTPPPQAPAYGATPPPGSHQQASSTIPPQAQFSTPPPQQHAYGATPLPGAHLQASSTIPPQAQFSTPPPQQPAYGAASLAAAPRQQQFPMGQQQYQPFPGQQQQQQQPSMAPQQYQPMPGPQHQQQQQQQQPIEQPHDQATPFEQPLSAGGMSEQQQMSPVQQQDQAGLAEQHEPGASQDQPPQSPQEQAPSQLQSPVPTENANETPISPGPQQSPSSPAPVPGHNPTPSLSPSGDFVAELPADMGSLNISEDPNRSRPGSVSLQPEQAQYTAYRPQSGSPAPSQSFNIPRRAVSSSSIPAPLAEHWKIADAATELPTREFYILADLLFDALDRKFAPHNTGLIEASKLLDSWKAQDLPDEVAQLFSYNNYTAFTRLWTLESIPHFLVPSIPTLIPFGAFDTNSEQSAQTLRISTNEQPADAPYPTYIPALNRHGWYKSLFLEALAEPESLHRMLYAFSIDTYRPGILDHPDTAKMDKPEMPGLAERAKEVRAVLERVCAEVAKEMQEAPPTQPPPVQSAQQQGAPDGQQAGEGAGGLSKQEMDLRMQQIKMQQQMSQMMASQMASWNPASLV
ncbi:hypothetical protein M011DRAFT_478502 [Sporormia fimetaria CBS 119925]|uniref:Uncharacterized protein n=1 Tax=Sporormia fimetaria CBS 119925 TaxID=1340428 RepID=A0A6A6V699_9PLEO|nr:hypothetical protein M011DRAFT_478502 [Sporormia fimetaria CBS 119925]